MNDINVIVVRRTHKRFLYLRHICPVTGKKIWKSSGTEDPERAQKLAGAWQTELERGLSTTRSASWSAFREAYEDHASVRLRETTLNKICSMFNVVEDLMSPDSLRRISPRWLDLLQKRLLAGGRSAATVASHCRHLKRALNWAQEQGMISSVPKFPKLNQARKAKQMKGRAVTGEEFDRLLAAVSIVFPDTRPNAQQSQLSRCFFCRGSGSLA